MDVQVPKMDTAVVIWLSYLQIDQKIEVKIQDNFPIPTA